MERKDDSLRTDARAAETSAAERANRGSTVGIPLCCQAWVAESSQVWRRHIRTPEAPTAGRDGGPVQVERLAAWRRV